MMQVHSIDSCRGQAETQCCHKHQQHTLLHHLQHYILSDDLYIS
jgi:hypothetical protein